MYQSQVIRCTGDTKR